MVGGHHASLVPSDFLQAGSDVDALVIGEGESTAVDLMHALRHGDSLERVPGVMTAANRERGFARRAFTRDFDRLAPPDRSLSSRYRKWYHHGPNTGTAPVETSRGWPFDCNVCSVWVFYERRAGRRAPAAITREIEGVAEEHVFFRNYLKPPPAVRAPSAVGA